MNHSSVWNYPLRIFVLAMLLVSVGLVMVYSSSASKASMKRRAIIERSQGAEALAADHSYHDPRFLKKQITWVCIGLVGMFIAYRLDYRKLKDIAPYLLGFSFFLLLLVYVPGVRQVIYSNRNAHYRWIGFGGFTFQPSELAKLALVIYMARMLTDRHDELNSFIRGVVPALVITGLFVLVIVVEPDIGAAAVLTAIIFLMWYVGGMRLRHMAGLIAATIPGFIFAIFHYSDRLERVLAFLNPDAVNRMNKGYQLWQSLVAVGSGGITGVGLGNSTQKRWLTEQYSDFIFAIICEELGLIGAALVVLCFFLLIWEGWRVALRGPDFFATLLAAGLTLMLAINATLNIMVVIGLLPTKGLVLPLLSYGGSNMLVTLVSLGVLMNIGKYVEQGRQRVRTTKRPRRVAKSKTTRRKGKKRWGWA